MNKCNALSNCILVIHVNRNKQKDCVWKQNSECMGSSVPGWQKNKEKLCVPRMEVPKEHYVLYLPNNMLNSEAHWFFEATINIQSTCFLQRAPSVVAPGPEPTSG